MLERFINHNKKEINFNISENYLNSIGEYINLIYEKKIKMVHYDFDINFTKISFISPVFNKEKYLYSLILSIQNQFIEEFEIIFIDDCSTDNSINIINNYSKIDKRIKLIKNKINKGTLYSRSQGALKSKGEYIIFIDSDDLILKEGIFNSYIYIKKNKLSMVQFNTIFKRNKTLSLNYRYYKYKNIIKQPILSNIFYYNENYENADEKNTALWDKIIEKSIVMKTINFIGEDYYNQMITIENDVILLFSLFQNADSYQYINETGYFYVRTNNDSISNTWNNFVKSNSIVHGLLVNIKFLYEKTGNTYFEKSFSVYKLQQSFKRYIFCFAKAFKEFNFVKNILKKMLASPYIAQNDKNIISIIDSSITLFYTSYKSKKKVL